VAKREGLSKKLRFEVFKRDSFTCQYCGRKSPDVILQVDHIEPVSRGGDSSIINLITSCFDCNSGKSDRPLSSNDLLDKQRAQLEQLNERREQLEMMLEWAQSLRQFDLSMAEKLGEYWSGLTDDQFYLNDTGMASLRKLLTKFPPDKIMEAMKIAVSRYVRTESNGKHVPESVSIAWSKVGGIATIADKPQIDQDCYYARAILRKRLPYLPETAMWCFFNDAKKAGVDGAVLVDIAKTCGSWTEWKEAMTEEIAEAKRCLE
jgi:hypothetical protein